MSKPNDIRDRLEYLRGELRAERMSYGELAELQDLASHIEDGDVELLEAAGVPEQEATQPQPPQGEQDEQLAYLDSVIAERNSLLQERDTLQAQRDELLKACQGLEQGAINVIASTVADGQRYSLYPSCLALATLETASKAARVAIARATQGGTGQ